MHTILGYQIPGTTTEWLLGGIFLVLIKILDRTYTK